MVRYQLGSLLYAVKAAMENNTTIQDAAIKGFRTAPNGAPIDFQIGRFRVTDLSLAPVEEPPQCVGDQVKRGTLIKEIAPGIMAPVHTLGVSAGFRWADVGRGEHVLQVRSGEEWLDVGVQE
jgi:hypothetical protein